MTQPRPIDERDVAAWLANFEGATPGMREAIAHSALVAGETAARCVLEGHAGVIAELRHRARVEPRDAFSRGYAAATANLLTILREVEADACGPDGCGVAATVVRLIAPDSLPDAS